MGCLGSCVIASLAAAGLPHVATPPPFVPAPPYYAMNPLAPPAPSPDSPLQQQILQNYRSRLLQTQRELQWQNQPGFSRAQFDVRRRLNQFSPGFSEALPPFSATAAMPYR